MDIVRDDADCWRFVRLLYLLNDEFSPPDIAASTARAKHIFERPASWPDREPLADVLAWTLMPNHFHLILREIREGGISKFMQRLCGSMSLSFNARYEEQGSIFQGSPKIRVVDSDEQLRYLVPYVLVKNPMQLYPGGLAKAAAEFDKAWKWIVEEYPFSSIAVHAAGMHSPIIAQENLIFDLFSSPLDFKKQSKDMLLSHAEKILPRDDLKSLFIEQW